MTLFAVFKIGIVYKACAGIFSTIELASQTAEYCIMNEVDDYHSYIVVAFELDTPTPQDPLVIQNRSNGGVSKRGGEINEPAPLICISREKDKVTKK